MLCVAVGTILPLLSPRINSPFPPNDFRLASSQPAPAHRTASGKGTATATAAHVSNDASLPSKTELQKALNVSSILPFYIFMKSTRSSCNYTSLPSLYYLHQCTSVWYWTLVPSSLLWNNLLEPLIYGLLLFWVTLHNREVTMLGKSKGLLKCFPSTFKSVTNSFISILQT